MLSPPSSVPRHPVTGVHFLTSFLSLGVPADLVTRLAALGVTEPYPIQTRDIA